MHFPSSESDFREAVVQGLLRTLRPPTGRPSAFGFLIAVGQALMDAELRTRITLDLQNAFNRLTSDPNALQADLAQASEPHAQIFEWIARNGIERLPLIHRKAAGDFTLQWNPLRGLRPAAMAQPSTDRSIRRAFTTSVFTRPEVIDCETFWQGEAGGRDCRLFGNLYPFARLHSLIFPDHALCRPQFLEEAIHTWAWRLLEEANFPGVLLGYNCLGGFASANHLHFHFLTAPHGVPVMRPHWAHNGGTRAYLTRCVVHDSMTDAWAWIDTQHRSEQPYNLLYAPGKVYCFARRHQAEAPPAPWTSGFAFFELSGEIIVTQRTFHDTLSDVEIVAEMHRVSRA